MLRSGAMMCDLRVVALLLAIQWGFFSEDSMCEFVHAGNCEHIKGEKTTTGRTVMQNELGQTLIEEQQKVGSRHEVCACRWPRVFVDHACGCPSCVFRSSVCSPG